MGGCLDRERDKRRILEQLSYSQRPILKQSNEFNYQRQIQSQSTKSQHIEVQQPRYSLLKYSQISSKQGNQSVRSDNQSYQHINQNNQFILLQRGELRQFLKTNHMGIDQIITNPLNPSQLIICFEQNDITDTQISEQVISNSNFHKLYMDIKDFIGQPDKKIVGIILENRNQISVLYKKLNPRQAMNNTIEIQLVDSVSQDQLEEIINERMQDNLICCTILQFPDCALLVFQTCRRQIQALNVISLEMQQLNSINLSQEIAGKVEILQSNDEFDFISLLPDVKNKSLYILMSIKQI
ncbi:unnamed protein product [Paramecium pentaurelia]|uniref:Uncharacterized protein n=1 Tax=Paramecium pentaurelia TaxID=43138 RepID=A0A8S1RWN4_9CILI|nr:unnamed protein product [Paramecium pentaurelia]